MDIRQRRSAVAVLILAIKSVRIIDRGIEAEIGDPRQLQGPFKAQVTSHAVIAFLGIVVLEGIGVGLGIVSAEITRHIGIELEGPT